MSSQCMVASWNLRHQRQVEESEEGNSSSHVPNQRSPCFTVPMSGSEVAELTWENGRLAMHGLGHGALPTGPTKTTWGRAEDTLESIVQQATCPNQNLNSVQHQVDWNLENMNSVVASSSRKWKQEASAQAQMAPSFARKRMRSESEDHGGRNFSSSNIIQEERADRSACASASVTYCRDSTIDATVMTRASFESSQTLKTKTTDEDSASHGVLENRDEENGTKGETDRSQSTRRSRVAAVHNESERRRRDRINQKIKALQKLVPNANKTDKASMLDEVIEYLKQLQAQVQIMTAVRNMPQMMMMMPLGMQQHFQMSLFARMGMGLGGLGMDGVGLLDMSTAVARTTPQSLSPHFIHPPPVAATMPPPFMVPEAISSCTPPVITGAAARSSVPFGDPYCTFLAQHSMNMDLYNKMAALYQQQVNKATEVTSSQPHSHNVRGQ